MSVTAVYNALNRHLSAGAIDLWTASSAEANLADLLEVLGLFGASGQHSLSFSAASLTQGSNSVQLTGSGKFGAPGNPAGANFDFAGTLDYAEDSSNPEGAFTLALRFTSPGWSFSSYFNAHNLPQTEAVDGATQSIIWGESFLNNLRIDATTFTGRAFCVWNEKTSSRERRTDFQLSGFLPDQPVFDSAADFVKPWPLTISGPLTIPQDWESDTLAMTLTARPAGSDSLNIGKNAELGSAGGNGPGALTLGELQLILSARNDLNATDWGRSTFSTLVLQGSVVFGDPNSPDTLRATIATPLLASGGTWHMTAFFPKDQSAVRGMAQLTTIFGLDALPLPDNFPLIDLFFFDTVELYFTNPNNGTPTLKNLAVTIGANIEWRPPVPFVTIKDLGTRWVWSFTYIKDKGRWQATSVVSGSVFGSFTFDDIGGGGSGGSGGGIPRLPAGGDGRGSGGAGGEVALIPPLAGIQLMADKDATIDVSVSLPDLFFQGSMRAGDSISLSKVLSKLFAFTGPEPEADMLITGFGFGADPIRQSYSGEAEITFTEANKTGWEIDILITQITLEMLVFRLASNAGSVSAGITGTFSVDPDAVDTSKMQMSADYGPANETDSGWVFKGGLLPGNTVNLTNLVTRFVTRQPAPSSLPVLSIDILDFEFNSVTHDYLFNGGLSLRHNMSIFEDQLNIVAAVGIRLAGEGNPQQRRGRLMAGFAVNKISVAFEMDVGVEKPTYLFKVLFDQIWAQAVTSWRKGKSSGDHQVVSVQLGGVTLGNILEYLVNLAAPTLGYRLDPPWDVLNRVDLSRFVLTIDPTDDVVEFTFQVGMELGVGSISSIGVRYTREGDGKVDMIVEGNFLGNEYKGPDALTWDVVNDPPPSVMQSGGPLIALHYLGIGQRIRIETEEKSVTGILKKLQDSMTEIDKPENLPGADGTVTFNAGSQWLIGANASLLAGTVDFGFLFNDPVLYGLAIGLNGERAGALAGLRFEILYKKITDDIGMFRVELRLPDAFRTFQFGVASLTLGVVVVEIYTNGNFMIDMGFPYNRNFDRSFSLQAYVFIGRGGLYFGLLNGATSRRVPRISNGNFSPVLELGVGISAGVGREIRAGILAGGAYVQIEVMFQGVLAWFHPASSSVAPGTFFAAKGVVAIHGRVYGYVDFSIVKVSVNLEAFAQAMVIYQSYQPLLIELSAGVRAEASVKVLFIRIHFSFHVDLELTFTIGSASPTPWVLAPGESGYVFNASVVRRSLGDRRRRLLTLRTHHAQRLIMSALRRSLPTETASAPQWNPRQQVFGAVKPLSLTLAPLFSIKDLPVNWNDTPPSPPATPVYRAAMILMAETGVSEGAHSLKAMQQRSGIQSHMAAAAEDLSLMGPELVAQGLLLYALYAIPEGPRSTSEPVSIHEIANLLEQLEDPAVIKDGFSLDSMKLFFENNLNPVISGHTGEATTKGGMLFPMLPFLSWTSPQPAIGNIDFADKNKVGPIYEWEIARLMERFVSIGEKSGPRPETDEPQESFASFLFRDYCFMVAKSGLEAVQKLLSDVKVSVGSGSGNTSRSLRDIADAFPSTSVDYCASIGDTTASVAEQLGASEAEIVFLNPGLAAQLAAADPGLVISVKLGVAPEAIAIDNQTEPFADSLRQISLEMLPHQVTEGETLEDIKTTFALPDTVVLFESSDGQPTGLGSDPKLLFQGAPFVPSAATWSGAPSTVTKALDAAAIFYSRYLTGPLAALAADNKAEAADLLDKIDWYAQTLFDLNNSALKERISGEDQELEAGLLLDGPASYGDPTRVSGVYTTVTGDTLHRIGFAFLLKQMYATTALPVPELPDWSAFLHGVSQAGKNWTIPALSGESIVAAGETMAALARRMIVDVSRINDSWHYNWRALLSWAGSCKILAPLAVVAVPGVTIMREGVWSVAGISARYGVPVADLAGLLADTAGLYDPTTELTVTTVPLEVVDKLLSRCDFGSIANQASRFLLAGLRLPLPQDGSYDPAAPVAPLYDISGQQFDIAYNPDAGPDSTVFSLSLSSSESWISFSDTFILGGNDDLDQLKARFPELNTLNPAVAANRDIPAGTVLHSATLLNLDITYTREIVQKYLPQDVMAVKPYRDPEALPVSRQSPRSYGLEHRYELQTPAPLPPVCPTAPTVGQPSLWPFSSDLLSLAAEAPATDKYELLRAAVGQDASADAVPIADAVWGTLLSFSVRKSDINATLFSLVGVPLEERATLLKLRSWLALAGNSAQASILLAPAPDAGNPSGFAFWSKAGRSAYIVKTNLSTESVPQPQSQVRLPQSTHQPDYYSDLSDLQHFLTFLWEGSVVGGTGYYIGVSEALPESLFDKEGNATIRLLLLVDGRETMGSSGLSLLPFDNCALIGPSLDASIHGIYAECSEGTGEMITQAVFPPGTFGFSTVLERPADTDNPANALRRLYSLLFLSAESGGFNSGESGMPVLPAPDDGKGLSAWERRRMLRRGLLKDDRDSGTPQPYWRYDQAIPLCRFGEESLAWAVTGLPAKDNDPYRSLGMGSDTLTTQLALSFGDVLGNRSSNATAGGGVANVLVGYTDVLIGPADLPASTLTYSVEGEPGDARMNVCLASRPSSSLPGPAQLLADVSGQTARMAETAGLSYYQLCQSDLSGVLQSALSENEFPVDIMPLSRYAAGAYLFNNAISGFAVAEAAGDGVKTIGDLLSAFSVRTAEVADVNANRPAASVFATREVEVPAFISFAENDSAESIASRSRPTGWPTIPALELLNSTDNGELPLRTGIILTTPPRSVPLSEGIPLKTIAANAFITPEILAAENPDDTYLAANVEFTVQLTESETVSITTSDKINSFTLLAAAFAAEGANVDPGALGTIGAGMPDLISTASVSSLTTTCYLVRENDTLAHNAAGIRQADIATNNTKTTNLFDTGAQIQLGYFGVTSARPKGGVSAPAGSTLQEFAQSYSCSVEALIEANSGFALPPGCALAIPGRFTWPDDPAQVVLPYTVRDTDTLDAVAEHFAFPAGGDSASLRLVNANNNMPGTLRAGASFKMTVAGTEHNVTIPAGSTTFNSLLNYVINDIAPDATMDELVKGIGPGGGILSPAALLIVPPASPGAELRPSDIPGLFGIGEDLFALANIATPDLIIPGKTLHAPDGSVTIGTQAGDTFNALVVRFSEQGVTLSAGDIVTAAKNTAVAFIDGTALALLPPAPVNFTAALGDGGPYGDPAFPLTASFILSRPDGAVHPDFRETAVASVSSQIAMAETKTSGEGVSLNGFITQLQKSLPKLRVASGKAVDGEKDLWIVVFDTSGIAAVTVEGPATIGKLQKQPWFFALKPLYETLVTRPGVNLYPVTSDGNLGDSLPTDFQGVDPEGWAIRFTADVDRFLCAGNIASLYSDPATRGAIDSVMAAKKTLTEGIAGDLAPVLDLTVDHLDARLEQAQKTLKQQLGVSLEKGYNCSLLLQYDATVESWWKSNAQGADLYGQISMPAASDTTRPWTMSAAKTWLDGSNPYVTFMMTVANPALHRSIEATLDYGYSHLEFRITEGGDLPAGYCASSWLTFPSPLSGVDKPGTLSTDLGVVKAPIPLRGFPDLPVVVGQQATASSASSPKTRARRYTHLLRDQSTSGLQDIPLWDYGFTYSHHHAGQDTVNIDVTFNINRMAVSQRDLAPPRDVFTELAAYQYAADDLWANLAELDNPGPLADRAKNSVNSFATLVGRVAEYWSSRIRSVDHAERMRRSDTTSVSGSIAMNKQFSYTSVVNYNGTEAKIESLTLSLAGKTPSPGPQGEWPFVTVQAGDKILSLEPGTVVGTSRTYFVPAGETLPAEGWPVITLLWKKLNVGQWQNAQGSIFVERNTRLLGEDGPDSNADFIFRTEVVKANGVVTPLIIVQQRTEISGGSLSAALSSAFDTLFVNWKSGRLLASFGVEYAYELCPDPNPAKSFVSELPVALLPETTITEESPQNIQTKVDTWKTDNAPNTAQGEWIVSLTLYSNLESAKRPLLTIERLFFPIPSD